MNGICRGTAALLVMVTPLHPYLWLPHSVPLVVGDNSVKVHINVTTPWDLGAWAHPMFCGTLNIFESDSLPGFILGETNDVVPLSDVCCFR